MKIENDDEHAAALAELELLMIENPPEGSPGGARLVALSIAIEEYETRRWPIPSDLDAK